MAYVKLIELERCRVGGGTFVEHGDRELALFRVAGGNTIVLTENACPHASGNLSGGDLTGSVVACPWHGWEFDLSTGRCVDSDRCGLVRYPVELRDGYVYADLDARA